MSSYRMMQYVDISVITGKLNLLNVSTFNFFSHADVKQKMHGNRFNVNNH